MPTFKTMDIMIFELIDQHSPVEMFVVGPVITSWQSILSTLLDDAYAFAFLCHLHGCAPEIHTVMNPHISQFINGAGLCSLSKSSNICSLNMH